jgi:hypothetical protein
MCGSMSVRAQICRHRGLVMWVAVSHAAMHSGMFLPVAPPMSDEPPLVAMTSPGVVTAAVSDAGDSDADSKFGTAPLMGAWATSPLVVAFGNTRPSTPRICDPVAVVVVVMSVVIGALTAGIAKSCAPGLN